MWARTLSGGRNQVHGTSEHSPAGLHLGKSDAETQRLILQAALLRPITERLLREAGIVPGMRILDLGCGAGDVSLLAGERVGPSGAIVGIDRDAAILAVAKARVEARNDLPQISFHVASVDAGLPVPNLFCESIVGGGPDSPLYAWFASTLSTIAPRWIEHGIATSEEIQIGTYQKRLEDAAMNMCSQLVSPPQFCAWVRKQ